PQGVEAGLEDVADQERVIAFPLGAQPVVDDLAGVEVFEIAVLVGDRAAGAEPEHLDRGARRDRAFEDRTQLLRVRSGLRAARNSEALVEQPHQTPNVKRLPVFQSISRSGIFSRSAAMKLRPVQCIGITRSGLSAAISATECSI